MAMKRKLPTKRRAKKKARVGGWKPKAAKPGIGKSMISRQVHWFVRRAPALVITGNGVSNSQFFGLNFRVSDVLNATEFVALFDQFKLTGVQMKFYLTRNPGNAAVVNGIRPRLYICTDYDTSTPPANFGEITEYSNSRIHQFDSARPYTWYIKPKQLTEVYRTAISTATAPQRAQWLSTSFIDAQHFGVRFGIENILDADYTIIVEFKYYFGVKNAK